MKAAEENFKTLQLISSLEIREGILLIPKVQDTIQTKNILGQESVLKIKNAIAEIEELEDKARKFPQRVKNKKTGRKEKHAKEMENRRKKL